LLKHSSIYAVGGIVNRAGAFLLLPLYTNYLTVAQYGQIELVYATSSIISSLLGIGLSHATLRFYFEYTEESERKRLVSTGLLGTLAISICGISVIWQFAPFLTSLFLGKDAAPFLLKLALLNIVFDLSTQVGYSYFRAKEYSLGFIITSIMQFLIQVSANYYFVAIAGKRVEGVLTGNLISVATIWIFVFLTVIRKCGIALDIKKLKSLLDYSYPFLFSTVFGVVLSNADRFLLKSFYSMDAVGTYSLAIKIITMIDILFSIPFKTGYGSFRFSIMDKPEAKGIQSRIVVYVMAIVGLLGLGICASVNDILRLLSSAQYWSAASLLPFLAILAVLDSVNYPLQTGILYAKKTKYMFYVSVLTGISKIIFNILLIPKLGAVGAVLSSIFVSFAAVLYIHHVSQKAWFVKYDYGALFKTFILSVLLYACLWTVSGINTYSMSLIRYLSIPIYFLFIIKLRCFNQTEVDFALQVGAKCRRWCLAALHVVR
jgi:O-antigen/teichoic acid export membrane protein